MATLPSNRIDSIASAIAHAVNQVSAKDADRNAYRDQAQEAADEATGARETLITSLANAAHADQWDATEREMALTKVKAQRNDSKSTSVATFIAEINRATGPSVRGHVADLFRIAHEAFDAEKDAEKDAEDKPLRKAFSRMYHAVVIDSFKALEAGTKIDNGQDLRALAIAKIRERERDWTKVHGRLQAIKAQLQKFYGDFPVDGINACIEFLGEVTEDELKACVAPTSAPAPVVTPEPEDAEPAEGASDLLQDAIDEQTVQLAA